MTLSISNLKKLIFVGNIFNIFNFTFILSGTKLANTLIAEHQVTAAEKGDFTVGGKFTFEVEGKGKNFSQTKDMEHSYMALDEIEIGIGNKIPLWVFVLKMEPTEYTEYTENYEKGQTKKIFPLKTLPNKEKQE